MTQTAKLSAMVLAAAILFVAPLANAERAAPDEIAGAWQFETGLFDGDCRITGQATFTPTGLKGAYACKFVSEQRCGKGGAAMYAKVEQTCTAQRVGKQVAIKSKVARIVEERPVKDGLYYADNFIVSMSKTATEMVGGHYDAIRTATARFWRQMDLVS